MPCSHRARCWLRITIVKISNYRRKMNMYALLQEITSSPVNLNVWAGFMWLSTHGVQREELLIRHASRQDGQTSKSWVLMCKGCLTAVISRHGESGCSTLQFLNNLEHCSYMQSTEWFLLYCIVLYCIDGWSLLPYALWPFQIYCSPPNLGITRTRICRLNFSQRSIFSGLRFFNESEISLGIHGLKSLPEDLS